MPSPPRKYNEEERELYAQIILTLFKPWVAINNINDTLDWNNSLQNFISCASIETLIFQIIFNFNKIQFKI